MLLSRRSLIAAASLSAAPFPARAQDLSAGAFTHGVASGDPTADAVILWTRFLSTQDGRVGWEVAHDEAFTRIAVSGRADARITDDFCVKVDVRGLAPGRRYFYRFLSASGPSQTGRTCTAPRDGASSLSIALFSCANYAFGYFHAYGHAAQRDDIDLVIHTGDYIYEYGRDTYPNAREAIAGRILEPAHEIVRLEDYHQRYALYHTDPDLLELRRLKPMTVIWDDHEIANNAWRDGAQNHQRREGDFADRIAAAAKAYFDWMPIRRPDPGSTRFYRALDWGDLATILLLDTRYIGRDAPINFQRALQRHLTQGGAEAAAAIEAFRRDVLNDPTRTMLGAAQEAWFAHALAQSKARGQPWQIVAQQVVMAEQLIPPGASRLLPDDTWPIVRRGVEAGERAGALGLPWNLDSWGGYPAARQRFLEACAAHANNAVVLGGDSHNCWLNTLAAPGSNRLAAIEFAGGSVTAPGVERMLSNAEPRAREALMHAANPAMVWCDLTHRGYGALKFTPTSCRADWLSFTSVHEPGEHLPSLNAFYSEASAGAGPGGWAV